MEDYNGYFTDFTGVITVGAFSHLSLSTIETNAYIIQNKAFYGCLLDSISLSNCSYIGDDGFRVNTIRYASMPKCEYIDNGAFYKCSSLQSISLPMCEYIDNYAFDSCIALKTITVGTEIYTVCSLGSSGVFSGCSALTSIYVPSS